MTFVFQYFFDVLLCCSTETVSATRNSPAVTRYCTCRPSVSLLESATRATRHHGKNATQPTRIRASKAQRNRHAIKARGPRAYLSGSLADIRRRFLGRLGGVSHLAIFSHGTKSAQLFELVAFVVEPLSFIFQNQSHELLTIFILNIEIFDLSKMGCFS